MNKKINMKNDIVFKAFFSRNERFLKSFLSAILGNEIKIKRITHDAKLEQLVKESKYGVLDIEVELESGEFINVEMQLRNNNNIEKRMSFYASKKIVEQLEPRQDFDELRDVIIIAILDYKLLDVEDYVNKTITVLKDHRDYEIHNIAKYVFIELPKFREENPNMNIDINQWLCFIDMERGDLLEMAKENNKEIKEAVEAYEVLTGDDEIKRLAEVRLMSEMEEKAALATERELGNREGMKKGLEDGMKKGMEKGKKKGLEEGEKKSQTKIAKKMLKENIPITQIAMFTDLTEHELEQIKEELSSTGI